MLYRGLWIHASSLKRGRLQDAILPLAAMQPNVRRLWDNGE